MQNPPPDPRAERDPDAPDPAVDVSASGAPDARPWWRRMLRVGWDWAFSIGLALVAVQVIGMMRAPELPPTAPEFSLLDLQGEAVALSDLRGQTVVLNFWATWCGPCRMEIPLLSDFADGNPDVRVLGLAADGTASELRRFQDQREMHYDVLRADAATLSAYNIDTYPTTVVVGPDGQVLWTYTGVVTQPQLAWAIR